MRHTTDPESGWLDRHPIRLETGELEERVAFDPKPGPLSRFGRIGPRPEPRAELPTEPMQDPEILLMHLERIGRCNKAWADYVESRATEVQDGIDRLCQFADLQEGLVADIVTSHAIALQVRLDEVLERHRNPEEGQTDE